MIKIPLLAIGSALLVSSCAPRYTSLPPAAGPTPDADALLKSMSSRLASAKQFRISAHNTIPRDVAERMHQNHESDVDVIVSRPDKFVSRASHNGKLSREMNFDGRTFTVVDGVNNFYSQAPLRGSLDTAAGQLSKVYGFQPPLAEFIYSDPYADIKRRVASVSYLGGGIVREDGKTTRCHRISLIGDLADAELWLGADDSLPLRLTVTRSNSGGKDLLVDIDFLKWDLNPQTNSSTFRFQPATGAEKIPMVTLEEADSASN